MLKKLIKYALCSSPDKKLSDNTDSYYQEKQEADIMFYYGA